MILSVPGLEWDGSRTLTIDGRRFPCGMMIDPAGELWGGPTMTFDPWCEHGWQVYIPTESGLAISISVERQYSGGPHEGWVVETGREPTIYCDLYAAWFPTDFDHDIVGRDAPVRAAVLKGEIVSPRRQRRSAAMLAATLWAMCDPEWLAEHVARISTLPVRLEPERRAGWIYSLAEVHERFRDSFDWRIDLVSVQ